MQRLSVGVLSVCLCALLFPALAGAQTAFPAALSSPLEAGGQLQPSGIEGEARFGLSVALSADGTTALVGAPGDSGLLGAAYPFTRDGTGWAQQGPKLSVAEPISETEEKLCRQEPGECGAGASVALSADGNTALVGAPRQDAGQGLAWLFVRSGSVWHKLERLTGGAEEVGEGRFGRSVALSPDGSLAVVGAPGDAANHGAVWIFARTSSGFVQRGQKLVIGGQDPGEVFFGRSLALSADASTLIVGSPADGAATGSATVFTASGEGWAQQGAKLTGTGESGAGRFGFSVALSADGSTALVGARNDEAGVGAAWAFARSGGGDWTQQGAKLTGPGESRLGEFGFSVALSASGDTALVGAPRDAGGIGAAWRFSRTEGVWTAGPGKLEGGAATANRYFGSSVALAANEADALIGAPRDSANAGTAWSFLGTALPAPTVSAVNPASGPSAGGTSVTIEGSGFLAGAQVQIGSAAAEVEVLSDTKITATTGASSGGRDEVIVTDLYGRSSGGPSFDFIAPPEPPHHEETTTRTPTPHSGVLASTTTALPAPTLAVNGNLLPVTGLVRFELPGSNSFSVLSAGQQVPFGTVVDATAGTVSVTTAGAHGETQIASFSEGEFKLTQSRNGTAQGTLVGGSFALCPRHVKRRSHRAAEPVADDAGRRRVRKLWAQVHGSYSTKGNYATGAALGTRWLTEDFCDGTLIVVATHRVRVSDLVRHRSVLVSAGHSYFARSR